MVPQEEFYGPLPEWFYPTDAGHVAAWPLTIENPNPILDWPLPYDPSVVAAPQIVGAPELVYGSPPPLEHVGDLRSMIPEPLWHAGEGLGQAIGHGFEGLGQAFGGLPQQLGAPSRIERKVSDVGDKTADAADAVKLQANQVGDDARRTMAMMQATMVSANRHMEETSKKTQDTAEMVKYVVAGIGALATVAILFHIIKQSSE